ncbi:ferric reductase [Thalassotalea sp. HSM 43]|uniref:ferredoxin reductase family protein n=1 Tax=Thalassotalea sp. HSM 43 TaxID=2552945 RepID=UPI00108102F8|nr:ferric reductase-like transmembrane domain-containing protein [Thalassotalea sp. HSM 43]QBY04545.1 ferric reductase [Thalassotalea sp. HSM 43]
MKRIDIAYWLIIISFTLLWLTSEFPFDAPMTVRIFKHAYMQYTGVMATLLMSVVTIMSLRIPTINHCLDGLDKVYRLHKWLGISALVFAVLHWFGDGIAPLLAKSGLFAVIETKQMARIHGDHLFSQELRDSAKTIGEIGVYVVILFVSIALMDKIPYHLFKKTHKWISVIYLLLVFHSVILTKEDYWLSAFGLGYGLIMLLGSLAAIAALLGKIGASKKTAGKIIKLTPYDDVGVIEATIEMQPGWPGHIAGQFAFLTSNNHEGAHPYTISSDWCAERRQLVFTIKALGDWTNQLRGWLKLDMPVVVEGPYGDFNFNDKCTRQIWIGAGIGITPFIAKMRDRLHSPDTKPIDLFVCASDENARIQRKLELLAKKANVSIHWYIQEKLSAEKIRQLVPEWHHASVWFCGPAPFGESVKNDMRKAGMKRADFHQELFQFR